MSQIHKTLDYSIFKSQGNREINPSHLNTLRSTFSKNSSILTTCPIVIDKRFNIIDGHHRLIVAKELNIPIYYLIDESCKNKEELLERIRDRNRDVLPWKLNSYIEFFCSQNKKEYLIFAELYEKYKKVCTFSTLVSICIFNSPKGIRGHEVIKSGEMVIKNKNELNEFLERFSFDLSLVNCPANKKMIIYSRWHTKVLYDLYFKKKFRVSYQIFFERVKDYYAFLTRSANYENALENISYICHKKNCD